MATDVRSTLRKELTKLNSHKAQIDRQISALETALGALGGVPQDNGARGGRRKMTPEARKAIGKRMKAYWAKRKKKTARRAA